MLSARFEEPGPSSKKMLLDAKSASELVASINNKPLNLPDTLLRIISNYAMQEYYITRDNDILTKVSESMREDYKSIKYHNCTYYMEHIYVLASMIDHNDDTDIVVIKYDLDLIYVSHYLLEGVVDGLNGMYIKDNFIYYMMHHFGGYDYVKFDISSDNEPVDDPCRIIYYFNVYINSSGWVLVYRNDTGTKLLNSDGKDIIKRFGNTTKEETMLLLDDYYIYTDFSTALYITKISTKEVKSVIISRDFILRSSLFGNIFSAGIYGTDRYTDIYDAHKAFETGELIRLPISVWAPTGVDILYKDNDYIYFAGSEDIYRYNKQSGDIGIYYTESLPPHNTQLIYFKPAL